MSAFVYGYIHRMPHMPASDVVRIRNLLQRFALRQHSLLVKTFVLTCPEMRLSLWTRIGATCRVARAGLVVPTLTHLHQDPHLAQFICQDLAGSIGHPVWVAGSEASAESGGREVKPG